MEFHFEDEVVPGICKESNRSVFWKVTLMAGTNLDKWFKGTNALGKIISQLVEETSARSAQGQIQNNLYKVVNNLYKTKSVNKNLYIII